MEIGVEEMPALAVEQALEQLYSKARSAFEESRLEFETLRAMATPRRLVLHLTGLAEEQASVTHEVKGPPKSAAFAADGTPQPPAIGFAKSQGVEPADLTVKSVESGEYVFAVKKEAGRPAADLLPALLADLGESISFQKSMRWDAGEFRFVRPIRWLLCLFGDRVIPFELAGLMAGRATFGHRLLSPGRLEAAGVDDYFEKLESSMVVLDQDRRRLVIERDSSKAAAAVEGRAILDETTLREVVQLVEWPHALRGTFAQEYARLPAPVLVAAMEAHQRYFPIEDESGNLLPAFVVVQNGDPSEAETIRRGHERVLRARLADAAFFFAEDRKRPLSDYVPRLDGVMFQEKLGSYLAKQGRVEALVAEISGQVGASEETRAAAERAARLAKADLVTEMVVEFPALQGTMGEVYARESGEGERVARAIGEQYKPRAAGDAVPETLPGQMLSVADKLDTIAGCFAIGLIPTSSQDPYGLRRQALGIIRTTIEESLPLRLSDLVQAALALLKTTVGEGAGDGTAAQIVDFFRQRARNYLLGEHFDYDIVDAVLAKGLNELSDSLKRLAVVAKLRSEGTLDELLLPYNRCKNLSRGVSETDVRSDLLVEDTERQLLEALDAAQPRVEEAVARDQFEPAVEALRSLRGPVDLFFEDVLVMTEDEAVRDNRLRMLARCAGLFETVADFSKIVQS